jgi:hypothetical protein
MGVSTTREDVENRWVEALAEELEGDVYKLQDIGELAEIWGIQKDRIFDIMVREELQQINVKQDI